MFGKDEAVGTPPKLDSIVPRYAAQPQTTVMGFLHQTQSPPLPLSTTLPGRQASPMPEATAADRKTTLTLSMSPK